MNVRENRKGNQEWTIQRNYQHWVHKTQDEDKKKRKTKTHTHTMPHRKPIKATKNGQSIDTGNMRHIKKQAEDKHTAKTSKKHNTAK